MKKSVLNHVALLVPSVHRAAVHLETFKFPIGPAEKWEGEGTLEIYVGNTQTQSGTLLLMEPIKEGAYLRAMNKRGPGLHHIAIDVLNIESFVHELAGSGWLLHPMSLKTLKASQTLYLARPGVPTLIEVQQRDELSRSSGFITEVRIPNLDERQLKMFQALGLNQVRQSLNDSLTIIMGNTEISFKDLEAKL